MKRAIISGLEKIGYRLEKLKMSSGESFQNVYQKYKEYTMIPEKTYIDNLALAAQVANVEGAIVECGVWRGGMIAGIAKLLGDDHRAYYLFDSFEGLPEAKEIDGEAALKWQSNTASEYYFDNCSAEVEYAEEAMASSGIKNYNVIKGWFSDTLPKFSLDGRIALLRLDGDWYDSTMSCLSRFVPDMADGGIVIVDDYFVWDGCSRAVHDYLSSMKSDLRIKSYNNRVCYLQKVRSR